MGKYEAYQIAKEAIAKIQSDIREQVPLFDCRLATSDGLPLKLPTGWRFPYDLLLDGVRIQEKPLILFVKNESSNCEIEYGDEGLNKIRGREYQEQELPTLDAIEIFLKKQFQYVRIETSERIVAFSEETANIQPYWRIGLIVDDLYRYSTKVSYGPDKEIQYSKPKPQSIRHAAKEWAIGRNRLQVSSRNMTIQLKDFPKEQTEILQSQWLILSCIAHAAEYLFGLGYQRINFYNIQVELANTSSIKSPSSGRVENIPVISFPPGGGWTKDPTIICHEVCHAVWDFLFTYPPKCLDLNSQDPREYQGIQEGFADYFAATLLVNDKFGSIEIGRDIPHETIDANNYGKVLPRLIDGNYYDSPELDPNEKIYGFGRKWANLLWDLRQRIGSKNADDIVFLAHFKPRTGENMPQEPIRAYFQSLIKTANDLEIGFTGWDQLAERHQI